MANNPILEGIALVILSQVLQMLLKKFSDHKRDRLITEQNTLLIEQTNLLKSVVDNTQQSLPKG